MKTDSDIKNYYIFMSFIKSNYCLEGAWNSAQYVLEIMSVLTLMVASILAYFSYKGNI